MGPLTAVLGTTSRRNNFRLGVRPALNQGPVFQFEIPPPLW